MNYSVKVLVYIILIMVLIIVVIVGDFNSSLSKTVLLPSKNVMPAISQYWENNCNYSSISDLEKSINLLGTTISHQCYNFALKVRALDNGSKYTELQMH